MRASQFELTAHRSGYSTVAASMAAAVPDRPWQTRWSLGRPIFGHQILLGHTGPVEAVAVGQLPDAARTSVIISGGGWEDSTIRVWRLDDGTPIGEPLHGHDSRVTAVTVGRLPDAVPVIVSADGDGTVRAWRLEDGTPVGDRYAPTHATWQGWPSATWTTAPRSSSPGVTMTQYGCGGSRTAPRPREPLRCADGVGSVAIGQLTNGTQVILASSSASAEVFRWANLDVWQLGDATRLGRLISAGPGAGLDGLAAGRLADGTPVVITVRRGSVHIGKLSQMNGFSYQEVATCRHPGMISAIAAGQLADGARSSSAAATTARCGCGGWMTAPRSGNLHTATSARCEQ